MRNNDSPDRALKLQIVVCLISLVTATIILSVLLPAYATWVVLSALLLFPAVSGFLAGSKWADPRLASATRTFLKDTLIAVVTLSVIDAIRDVIFRRNDFLKEMAFDLGYAVAVLAAALCAFYLGRAQHRRKIAGA